MSEKPVESFENKEIADMIENVVNKIHNVALTRSFSKIDEAEDDKDMKLIFAEYLFNSQSLLLQTIERIISENNRLIFELLRKIGDNDEK